MALRLNEMPVELLRSVCLHLQPSEYIQLLTESFSRDNPNIGEALSKQLNEDPVAYSNRIIQNSFIEMYMLTPSENYMNKSKLSFLRRIEDVVAVVGFPGYRPSLPLTLTYYIWNLMNLSELLELTQSVGGLNQHVHFNIELEFDPGILQMFDLGRILDVILTNLGSQFSQLMVKNYTGAFNFEISRFPQLTKVWLEHTNVRFRSSFRHNHALDFLLLRPNSDGFNDNKPVVLNKSLPQNLRWLNLAQCIINPNSINYPIPTNLEELSLQTVKDVGGEYVTKLVEANIHANLKHIAIDNILYTNLQLTVLQNPSSILKMVANTLIRKICFRNLPADPEVWNFAHNFPSLEHLDVSSSIIGKITLPKTLQELHVSNNSLCDISPILDAVPPKIRVLNLGNNPIAWSKMDVPVRFPQHIRYLKLNNTLIGDFLPNIEFPDSVEILLLEVNLLRLVDGIKFPRNLRNLGIGSNRIGPSLNFDVPLATKVIHTTENRIHGPVDLSYNHGQPLNLDIIYFNYNKFSRLDNIKFPSRLRLLNFDDCLIPELENIKFNATIMELSFHGCGIRTIKNVLFEENSNLTYFNLSRNYITDSALREIAFPADLKCVDLSNNRLEVVDESAFSSINFININLSINRMKKLRLRLNETLRILDVSANSLRSLQLTFPPNTSTNLRCVNLSMNKLTAITPQHLGHNVAGVLHDRLLELDLTENKIKQEAVQATVKEFPPLLRSLLIGYTGVQDRYGYEIGCNILNDDVYLGKKIDTPYS